MAPSLLEHAQAAVRERGREGQALAALRWRSRPSFPPPASFSAFPPSERERLTDDLAWTGAQHRGGDDGGGEGGFE
jgi:hypothetical protein